MPTPKRGKLEWYATGSPKLAFLSLAQPHTQACINHHILHPDAAACSQRVNASKSRTACYSGRRTLSMPTPQPCHLA